MGTYPMVRQLRRRKGISQKAIAEKLFLQTTTYARYERGERELPLNIAIMLADFYGVSLDYLAGRSKNKDINQA